MQFLTRYRFVLQAIGWTLYFCLIMGNTILEDPNYLLALISMVGIVVWARNITKYMNERRDLEGKACAVYETGVSAEIPYTVLQEILTLQPDTRNMYWSALEYGMGMYIAIFEWSHHGHFHLWGVIAGSVLALFALLSGIGNSRQDILIPVNAPNS